YLAAGSRADRKRHFPGKRTANLGNAVVHSAFWARDTARKAHGPAPADPGAFGRFLSLYVVLFCEGDDWSRNVRYDLCGDGRLDLLSDSCWAFHVVGIPQNRDLHRHVLSRGLCAGNRDRFGKYDLVHGPELGGVLDLVAEPNPHHKCSNRYEN